MCSPCNPLGDRCLRQRIAGGAIQSPGSEEVNGVVMHSLVALWAGGRAAALTLTYRGKPLARIVPLKPNAEISPDDPVFRLYELAEPLGPLTNAEMDAAIYGQ
jgi:hypothetical protein